MINFIDIDCGPNGLGPIINIVRSLVTLIQWAVPILLIVFGTIDLGKAVIAGKEDEMKKAQGTLIRRVMYAVAVFLVVTLVTFIMNIVSDANAKDTDSTSWLRCWNSSNSGSEG